MTSQALKENSMLRQKEMVASHYHALARAKDRRGLLEATDWSVLS